MDQLHDRLKDLILFLNENSEFEILAVELDFYRHEDLQIVIPRVFGGQTRKRVSGSKRWDENTLEDYLKRLGEEHRALLHWAFEFGQRLEDEGLAHVTFGAGQKPQKIVRTSRNTIFRAGVTKGDKEAHFNLPMHQWKGDHQQIQAALAALGKALGTTIEFDPNKKIPIAQYVLRVQDHHGLETALRELAKALK